MTEVMKFVVLSLLFHKDEQVVSSFIVGIRELQSDMELFEKSDEFAFVNAIALFCGCTNYDLRKHSLRLLQLLLLPSTVKVVLNPATHEPYLSVPSYLEGAQQLLFGSQAFKQYMKTEDFLLNAD